MSLFKRLFNIQPTPSTFTELTTQEKEIIKRWILEEISNFKDGKCDLQNIAFLATRDNSLSNRLPRKIDFSTNLNDYLISPLFNCLEELSLEKKIISNYSFEFVREKPIGRRDLKRANYQLSKDTLRDIQIEKLLQN